MKKNPRRERVAYHEAGHAVMAWAVGSKLRRVDIEKTEGREGQTHDTTLTRNERLDYVVTDRARLKMEGDAQVFLAGRTAEIILNPRSRPYGYRGDYSKAIDLVSCFAANNRVVETHLAYLEARAHAALTRYWPAVVALALALLAQVTVSGDEAERVITEALQLQRGARKSS
jgi:hypothetical protein